MANEQILQGLSPQLQQLLRDLPAYRAACAQKPTLGKRHPLPRPNGPDVQALFYYPTGTPLPAALGGETGAAAPTEGTAQNASATAQTGATAPNESAPTQTATPQAANVENTADAIAPQTPADVTPPTALPVVFNLHGGGWIGGDAILMESFCQLLADKLPALVVNLNYTKADEQPLPFAQYELRDAVLYLAAHAQQYGVDPARMVVGGHSAGAHIAAGAAMLLRQARFALAGQMLVYPATDLTPDSGAHDSDIEAFRPLLFAGGGQDECWASPLRAPDDCLQGLAPAVGILCGQDVLRPQGAAYFQRLKQNGVPVTWAEYPTAQHGFLEVNQPEYPADERQSPAQAALARRAEAWLVDRLRQMLTFGF